MHERPYDHAHAPSPLPAAWTPKSLLQRRTTSRTMPSVALPIVQLVRFSAEPSDLDPSASVGARFGHDFGKIRVHNNDAPWQLDAAEDRTTDQTPGSPGSTTHPPAPGSEPVSVDRIDIVDGPAGAVAGLPTVRSRNLSAPGPVHGLRVGEDVLVCNIHQIHFHLDSGNSAMLTPKRLIERIAITAGVEDKRAGDDGPSPREVLRPTSDRLVVADAPGRVLSKRDYPYSYQARFTVTVSAPDGRDIARVRYDVGIRKLSEGDVPNKENRIVATAKEDLIRGMALP